jgi:hypothetical protein
VARVINAVSGGVLVGAWDVPQLDEATVEGYLAVRYELPRQRQAAAKIEQAKAKFRDAILKRGNRLH